MEPTTVTVKKAFAHGGGMVHAGTTMDIFIGATMTQERFNTLLEIGAITLGVDLEYLKQTTESD